MDVGDATGDRILDRNHRQRRPAFVHGADGVFEGPARQGRQFRPGGPAGEIGIGAGGSLEGDGMTGVGGTRPAQRRVPAPSSLRRRTLMLRRILHPFRRSQILDVKKDGEIVPARRGMEELTAGDYPFLEERT